MHLAQWPCLDCTGNDSTIVTQISILALLWYVSDAWGGSIPPRPQFERILFYCNSSLFYSNILPFLLFIECSFLQAVAPKTAQVSRAEKEAFSLSFLRKTDVFEEKMKIFLERKKTAVGHISFAASNENKEVWVSGRNQHTANVPSPSRVPKVHILLLPQKGKAAKLESRGRL